MKYPFKKNHIRLLSLALVLVMITGLFTGCGLFAKEETEPSTEPSVEATPPGLVEVKPTETTTPPTEETQPLDKNGAVINTDKTAVRQTPSTDADPIGHLDKGTAVTIIREVSIANVGWALIREGWVKSEALDKNFVPEETTGEETIQTPGQIAQEQNGGNTTTTKPENTNNNTGNAGNTNTNTNSNTKGTPGVILASELNIRKEANQNSDRVGAYTYGNRITILETSNGWGRTDKGWVSLNYVYQDGAKGNNGCMTVVTASQLNVRSGPGTNYDKVDAYNYGARVEVLQQIKIANVTWGCTNRGWISMEHVYIDGTEAEGAGIGTCNGNNVNIRSGPGTNYAPVGSANMGDDLDIYAQIEIGTTVWGYVQKGNTKGWMSMAYANMG